MDAAQSGFAHHVKKTFLRRQLYHQTGDAGQGGLTAVLIMPLPAENSDVLLLGTLHQYELLTAKLRLQPFKLKYIAEDIDRILQNAEPAVKNRLAGKSYPWVNVR